MAEEFFMHQFDNGITLLAQRMEQMSSAAVMLAFAGGSSYEPSDLAGAGTVGSDWLTRGAGERDTRQLNDALDSLGCQHNEDCGSPHLTVSAAMLGRNLPEALPLFADIVRRPQLGDDSFEPCRALVQQALEGLEDEPARQCNLMIRERFYPSPLGRISLGTRDTLKAMTPAAVRRHLHQHLTPQGAIFSVAGRFEWNPLRDTVGRLFGDWQGQAVPPVATTPPANGITHITKKTAQVQITLAYPAPTIADRLYYPGRLAQMVLSGGGFSRLMVEVREKRGLVYHVSARYHGLKQAAGIFVYAGTAPARAQETLEITVGELHRLSEGVQELELVRARTQLKAALVMQGESTGARADGMASDWHHLGRLRSLDEIAAAIDAVTVAQVAEYVRAWPARNFTALTIGPGALNTACLAKG